MMMLYLYNKKIEICNSLKVPIHLFICLYKENIGALRKYLYQKKKINYNIII